MTDQSIDTAPPSGSEEPQGSPEESSPQVTEGADPEIPGSGAATPKADAAVPQTRAERRAAQAQAEADAAAASSEGAQRSGFRRAADLTGRILIGAGVLVLLFTAYQIFGTSVQESHSQSALRTQLDSEAHRAAVSKALAKASSTEQALPSGPPVTAPHTEAPAEGDPVGDIRIPKIGLSQVVVEGTGTDDLRKGPGHYTGTPLPGQSGNASIAGHRTTYGHPFYNLDAVQPGDTIVVTTLQGVFVYDVFKQEVVSPSDATVVDDVFANWLTLTTCNPRFSASSRLVVVAKLAHSELFTHSSVATVAAPRHPQAETLAGDTGVSLTSAIVWGAVVVVVGALVLYLARRYRRYRWPVWIVGSLGVVVLLYAFFGAVSPLLPASF